MRKHVTSLAILATVAAVLSSSAVQASSASELPEKTTNTVQVKITNIGGVEVKDREVVKGEGLFLLVFLISIDKIY